MATIRRLLDYRVEPFDLQLFAAVIEHGTITAAARSMSLSLAATSSRIQALEHLVGVKLLDRAKSGATPTDAGRALAREAHRVLAALDSLHIEMAAYSRGLRGRVRLLCNTAAMSETLPPRLGRFLIEHPDIDLELQELPSDAVIDALRRGIADVGVIADYVDTSGLITWPWTDDELVALLPDARKARRSTAIGFAHLLDRPFVGLTAERGLSRFLAQQAARSGRVPHHRVRVSGFDAVAQLVAAGVGVAVMPRSAANRWREAKVQIVPLADDWAKRRLLICTSEHYQTMPGTRLLVDAMLRS